LPLSTIFRLYFETVPGNVVFFFSFILFINNKNQQNKSKTKIKIYRNKRYRDTLYL
jgi:hypothetical protein